MSEVRKLLVDCMDAVGTEVEYSATVTRDQAIRLRHRIDALFVDKPWTIEQGAALSRERNRLRAVLDRVHAELQNALNATPLDSPSGTGSGFTYEAERREAFKP